MTNKTSVLGNYTSDGRRMTNGRENLDQFESMYQREWPRIYRFCYRLTGNATQAEDLAMDVFAAAYAAKDRFEGRCTAATWLHRIAMLKWREMNRKAKPVSPIEEHDIGIEPEDGIAEMVITSALQSLPDHLREAFVLVKLEGLKYREAAEILNVPMGTVQSRIFEATTILRRKLGSTFLFGSGGG